MPGEQGGEPVAGCNKGGDRAVHDVAAVTGHFAPSGGQQLGGWHAVTGEVSVHVGGWGVPWATRVHHEDLSAGPG